MKLPLNTLRDHDETHEFPPPGLTFLPLALPAIACGDDAAQPSQALQGGNNPYVLVTGEREQESNYRINTLQDPGPHTSQQPDQRYR